MTAAGQTIPAMAARNVTFAHDEVAFGKTLHVIAGKISATNDSLNDEPEKVNKDPYGDGWMIKMTMKNSGEVDSLLTAAEYEDFTKAEE